jgi:hypothetical protein
LARFFLMTHSISWYFLQKPIYFFSSKHNDSLLWRDRDKKINFNIIKRYFWKYQAWMTYKFVWWESKKTTFRLGTTMSDLSWNKYSS